MTDNLTIAMMAHCFWIVRLYSEINYQKDRNDIAEDRIVVAIARIILHIWGIELGLIQRIVNF